MGCLPSMRKFWKSNPYPLPLTVYPSKLEHSTRPQTFSQPSYAMYQRQTTYSFPSTATRDTKELQRSSKTTQPYISSHLIRCLTRHRSELQRRLGFILSTFNRQHGHTGDANDGSDGQLQTPTRDTKQPRVHQTSYV